MPEQTALTHLMAVWRSSGMNRITSSPMTQLRRIAVRYGKSAYAVGMSNKSCVSIVSVSLSAGSGKSSVI